MAADLTIGAVSSVDLKPLPNTMSVPGRDPDSGPPARRPSGCCNLPSDGPGRQVTQGRMGPFGVVVDPPSFDPLAGVGQGHQPAGVQAFGPNARVKDPMKALSVGVPGLKKSSSTPLR